MEIIDQRAEHYGDPRSNHHRIAGLWSAYLDTTISAHDVAAMMVLLKIARAKLDPFHDDNITDAIGYAEIMRRVR